MDSIGLLFFDSFYKCSLALKKDGTPLYSEIERKILIESYGLADSEVSSFKEIALELDLSRERVRQIHLKIFKRMAGLKRQQHPATLKIDYLISNNGTVDIHSLAEFGPYIKLFHREHMPEYKFSLLLSLLSFYIYITHTYSLEWRRSIKEHDKELALQNKTIARFETFSKKILWFENVSKWTKKDFLSLKPTRDIPFAKDDSYSISGTFRSEKLKRDVHYESLLEKKFYFFLDNCPDVIHYVEQCTKVHYTIKGKQYTYTPDVTVFLNDGRCFIVEIKPLQHMVEEKTQIKFNALVKYCKEKGFGALLTNGNKDLNEILSYTPNPDFEKALKERFHTNKKPMFYPEYLYQFKEKYNATGMHLSLAIIRLKLTFKVRPIFTIEKKKEPFFCPELF